MELEKFTRALDWGTEIGTSLVGIVTLLICVLIARFTVWGRQFWRITGAYFSGAESARVWVWLGVILLLVVGGVRLEVLLSYQSNDMLTAFQAVAAGLGSNNEEVR